MDSAASLAVSARDPSNQGIYGIKKPKNIFDADSNVESQIVGVFNDIMTITGLEPGKHCDPSKATVRWILLLTDGDIDGAIIACNTVCLLAKHCKPAIDAGMVGRIIPPAYSFLDGKKKVFVHSQREFYERVAKDFVKRFDLSYHGNKMSKKEFSDFVEKNFEYNMRLAKLANRYTCEMKFMEYIASRFHGDWKTQTLPYWKRALKDYPDLSVIKENDHILIDGTIGMDSYHIPMDEYFSDRCLKFKEFQNINHSIDGYELNGKAVTVYEIMHEFDKHKPKGIQRYKGLGELEVEEMRDLCMNREKRSVIIFKFDDYEKDMEKLNIAMSSSAKYSRARKEMMHKVVLEDVDLDT